MSSVTSEITSGPTPNGGDRAIASYFDDNDNLVEKDKATKVVIQEMKGNKLLNTTYGNLRR